VSVHPDVATAVDALVRGFPEPAQIRYRKEDGSIGTEMQAPPPPAASRPSGRSGKRGGDFGQEISGQGYRRQDSAAGTYSPFEPSRGSDSEMGIDKIRPNQPIRIYPYGVARNRLTQAAKRLGVPAVVVRDIADAQALITLRAYYRNRQATILNAEDRGMPVYVLRANTVSQMEQFLADIFNLDDDSNSALNMDATVQQTQAAIEAVMNGERFVDLPPAAPTVRRLQHELAKQNQLVSQSYGKEPYRRVRIFRE
jgi:hypothetical protein